MEGVELAIATVCIYGCVTVSYKGTEIPSPSRLRGQIRTCKRNLGQDGLLWDYDYSALGLGRRRGRLHVHMLTFFGPFIRWRVLAAHARRAGLGSVDIRGLVTAAEQARAVSYVARNGLRLRPGPRSPRARRSLREVEQVAPWMTTLSLGARHRAEDALRRLEADIASQQPPDLRPIEEAVLKRLERRDARRRAYARDAAFKRRLATGKAFRPPPPPNPPQEPPHAS